MPTYKSSQDWLEQARLLLEAHPETTTITTTYSLRAAPAPRPGPDAEQLPDAGAGRPPRARLVIKAYDPVSGAALCYRTGKAAEVGRLVQMLGGLGRAMTGTPAVAAAAEQPARADGETPGEDEAAAAAGGSAPGQQQPGAAGGGPKGKKKKKGKR